MKTFILKISLFIGIFICYYIIIFLILNNRLESKISSSQAILLGDSHTEFLDLPQTIKYSKSGSPYIVHYNFVKRFKKKIKGKKIFISFGYHNIANYLENRFRSEIVFPGWLEFVNTELSNFNLIGKSYNYEWQKGYIIKNIFTKRKLVNLYNMNFNKWPSNTSYFEKDTSNFIWTIKKHYLNPKYRYKDKMQKKYLSMLIKELEVNNNEIILINTPETEFYLEHVPSRIKKSYYNFIAQNHNVKFIDFNSILKADIDSTYFRDADHVNQKGDRLVEKYLIDYILD